MDPSLETPKQEQNDELFREVFLWRNLGSADQSPNLPAALRKCRKSLTA